MGQNRIPLRYLIGVRFTPRDSGSVRLQECNTEYKSRTLSVENKPAKVKPQQGQD